MADIKSNNQFLTDPSQDVKKKWLEVKIQEKSSQISRTKQDIEDIKKGQIVQLEAHIMMLERDKDKLLSELNKLSEKDIIDVN